MRSACATATVLLVAGCGASAASAVFLRVWCLITVWAIYRRKLKLASRKFLCHFSTCRKFNLEARLASESWVENTVVDLLTARGVEQAVDFFRSWDERRNASWANAHRDAMAHAASGKHVPQARGQLRQIYGENAVREAASSAKAGSLPVVSAPPGGVFMAARIGRFALSSITVRHRKFMPRRSITRILMSARNHDIDPQVALALSEAGAVSQVAELAYFGCLVAIPCRADPTVPSDLLLAVPNSRLTDWVLCLPLPRLHALLQDRATSPIYDPSTELGDIPDRVFSTFRIPTPNKGAGDENPGG